MSRILWWTVAILAATVVFVGPAAAGSLRDTIATTGGATGGLVVGGIPTFVSSFKSGMDAGGSKGTPGTTFKAPAAAQQKPGTAPASSGQAR